jgi:hypothetical protein
VETIIELLQIVIESDDEAIASDAESILLLYENDETLESKLMGLEQLRGNDDEISYRSALR